MPLLLLVIFLNGNSIPKYTHIEHPIVKYKLNRSEFGCRQPTADYGSAFEMNNGVNCNLDSLLHSIRYGSTLQPYI